MELYWKAAAGVMLTVVMVLMLRRQEIGTLLVMGLCAMVALAALDYLRPVVELLTSVQALGGLDQEMLGILLKAVGIGLITEITAAICSDSGNGSAGKALQLLGTTVILWMSIPLFTAMLELIQEILESV